VPIRLIAALRVSFARVRRQVENTGKAEQWSTVKRSKESGIRDPFAALRVTLPRSRAAAQAGAEFMSSTADGNGVYAERSEESGIRDPFAALRVTLPRSRAAAQAGAEFMSSTADGSGVYAERSEESGIRGPFATAAFAQGDTAARMAAWLAKIP